MRVYDSVLRFELIDKIKETNEKFADKPELRCIYIPKGAFFFTFDELDYILIKKVVSEYVDPVDVERRYEEYKSQREEDKKFPLVCESSSTERGYTTEELYEEVDKLEREIFDTIDSFMFDLKYYFSKTELKEKEEEDFNRIKTWLVKMSSDFSLKVNEFIWHKVRVRYMNVGMPYVVLVDFLEDYLHREVLCKEVEVPQFVMTGEYTCVLRMVKTHARCPMKFHPEEWRLR